MTIHVFPFYGTIQQCWDVFFTEYNKLKNALGHEPFIFEAPKHEAIHEYAPKDGDEIMIEFQDSNARRSLISVEAEPKPGDPQQLTIFIHAHENTFQEPGKSAIQIWKQIEQTMRARGHLPDPQAVPQMPVAPLKPASGSRLDAWFDWYHARRNAGLKTTLEDVALETGYTVGTIKQLHAAYAKERGLVRKKTNQK